MVHRQDMISRVQLSWLISFLCSFSFLCLVDVRDGWLASLSFC
jgi:hypothetical protein